MKNIAIYYRVSTDKQDLNSQETAINAWLEGLPLDKKPKKIRVFKDEGISGKTLKRPGFQKMMNMALSGKIDTIICYRLDRFSRDANTAIRLLLNLDESGVAFVSITQPILNLGHENPFRRTILAAFAEIAEIERETTIARVRAGLEAAKRRGVKLGRKRTILEQIRERVRELKAAGQSYRQIASQASISLGAVHKILKGG